MIEITSNGLTQLIGDLRKMPAKLEKTVILRMSQIASDSAEVGAGRHGSLRNAIENRQIVGGRAVGHDKIAGNKPLWVNFGTRPHKIYPNKRKALRWAGPNGFIFAKVVNHPGYIGDNYMLRAKDDAIAQFNTILDAALKESI